MRCGDLIAKAQAEQLRSEMELLLCSLLNCERLDLIAHPERELPVEQLGALQLAWARVKKGEPLAYILGVKEFYALDFKVDSRVLIPRGESEFLVEKALELPKGASVLEIGTGSGAIAVSVKKTRPDLTVVAGDVSAEALEVAKANAELHGVDVNFVESDLMANIEGDFDLLLANLPYIGTQEHDFIMPTVALYEPDLALYGGEDGLDLYRRLFEEVKARDIAVMVGEIAFTQGQAIAELCEQAMSEYSFELVQDLQGLDRHFILKKI